MSAVDFMKLVSENPAKLYGMYPKKGTLAVGSDGDITIVDKHIEHMLSKESPIQRLTIYLTKEYL